MTADRDALLQSSRRVDWRFLLPDPDLGSVACIGADDPALEDALRLLSESLTFVNGAATGDERGQYDVVVLRDPEPPSLERAARLVVPGGWLYLELHGPLTRRGRRLRRPWLPPGYAAAVEQLGFVDIQAHWHWPDFDSCLEIVPLGDAGALEHALARRHSDAAAQLKRRLGRLVVRSGLFPWLAPHVSIVARWPGEGRGGQA